MNSSDIVKYLNVSARKYYDYLKKERKSIIKTPITLVKKYKDYYVLYTKKALKSGYEIGRLEILGKVYPEDSFKFVYADDIGKRYCIATKNIELISALSLANENNASFVSDLTFLVKRVEQWSDHNVRDVRFPLWKPRQFNNIDFKDGSPSQIEAIKGVMENPITYVWGAPGTGKTRFVLARCIPGFIHSKKRIIITAPTNNALEQTLRGIIEVLESNNIDYKKYIFRAGVASYEFSMQFPQICENTRSSNLIGKLNQDKEYAQKLLEYEKIKDKALQTTERVDSFCQEVQSLLGMEKRPSVSDVKSAYFELKLEYSKSKERYYFAEQDLAAVNKLICYYTKKWFVRKKRELLENLTAERLSKNDTKDEELRVYRNIEQKKKTLENIIEHASSVLGIKQSAIEFALSEILKMNFDALRDSYEASIKISDIRMMLGSDLSAKEIIESCTKQIAELEKDTAGEKYKTTQIIALTIDRLISDFDAFPWEGRDKIYHIFLDECGICPLAKAIPLLATGVPVAMFGDHMQLPPVCEMNDEEISLENNREIFMWSQTAMFAPTLLSCKISDIYDQWVCKSTDFKCLVRFDLTDSFRFGPELASILAGKVYSSGFRGNSKKSTKIIVIDAGRKQPGDKKRTSLSEAKAIKKYIQVTKEGDNDYAIITPYKNQIALLKQILQGVCDTDCIYTVHASQGREWKKVFFSVVDCNDMYFTNSNINIGIKVINTALSRAIEELIVVCDYSFWHENVLCNKQLLTELTNRAMIWQ